MCLHDSYIMHHMMYTLQEESSRMLQRWGLLRNLPGAAQQEESGDDDSGALHDSLLRSGSAKRARSAESKSNILTGTSFSSVGMVDASRQTGRDNTPAGVRRWDSYYAQLYGAEVDPVGFSYFLAANLPISNECLQSLLEAQDVVDRLRCRPYCYFP